MISSMESTPVTTRPTYHSIKKKTCNKIALEEAVATNVFDCTNTLPPVPLAAELPYDDEQYVKDVERRLMNVESRVAAMDSAGVALAIVSLTMPGIEGIFDTDTAVETASKVNTELYEKYSTGRYADRFRAFGCVPMQNPQTAAQEAERCIKELGFVGVLVNGFSNIGDANTVQYLDEAVCEPFWAKMEELDAPVYLHPRIPAPNQLRIYQGYEFLTGSCWGFSTETAVHDIRLMVSGLFDRNPRLKIILGHSGEGLPFYLYRIDHRLRHFKSEPHACKLRLQDYWERNFWGTTAGILSDGTLHETIRTCGEDRVMWSADYPYEDYDELGEWFDGVEMSGGTVRGRRWDGKTLGVY